MARLRTSLVNAINNTKEQLKNNKVTIEEAAHNAALTFNEDEQEVLNKVKTYIEKESRKTGKVGRPKKQQTVEITNTKTSKKTTNKNTNNKTNNKTTTAKRTNTKMVADAEKNEDKSNENIKKAPYIFSGEVSIKNYGIESKINVTIETNESDYEKAKEYVLKKFYDNNILVFISNKDFGKNLKNA